jgi:hypothetical protein
LNVASILASLSSIVSSVAVVVSLIYLSFQLRQNSLHQRNAMQQRCAARNVDLISRTAESDIATAMLRVRMADPDLEPVQLEQFLRVLTAIFLNFEDGYLLRQSGMLDAASVESDAEALRGHIFAQPGYRIAWQMLRSGMQPDFRAHMDALMAKAPIVPSPDCSAIWRRPIAERAAASPGA